MVFYSVYILKYAFIYKKIFYQEEKQRRFLEKLGFVQMVFDFYTAPVA